MPEPKPEPTPRQLHIATRFLALTEEVHHFSIIAAETKVPAEKADADARVEVATTLLSALEKLTPAARK